MILDNTSKDIILISYPSGGFGHFLYYVLTEFASGTVKVNQDALKFSDLGDCHSISKYTETYFMDPDEFSTTIDLDVADKKILVLCDNGINNDQYQRINQTFPNATKLRLVVNPSVRPVIYQTCAIKAMGLHDLVDDSIQHLSANWSDADEEYAKRENYTLMYHQWAYGWLPDPTAVNVSIEKLILDPVNTIVELINSLGMTVTDLGQLQEVADAWLSANQKYFSVYYNARAVMYAVSTDINIDISHISDLHEQGYINYCLETTYNITIPVYDYRKWFLNTAQIVDAIREIQSQ